MWSTPPTAPGSSRTAALRGALGGGAASPMPARIPINGLPPSRRSATLKARNERPHERRAPARHPPPDIPVPPELVEALGYRGEAGYVGFHYINDADDLVFDDGESSGTGNTR